MNNKKIIYVIVALVALVVAIVVGMKMRAPSGSSDATATVAATATPGTTGAPAASAAMPPAATGAPATSTDNAASMSQTGKPSKEGNSASPTAAQPTKTVTKGCPNNVDPQPITPGQKFIPTIDLTHKVVTLNTNFGPIKIALYDQEAPKTVENFVCLTQKGYYNNLTFHRIAKGFVIQGGDPEGTGEGGKSIYGGAFEDEIDPASPIVKAGYVKGTVAMANSGPNTNGSQFFILIQNYQLNPAYTIFGHVISGMSTVEKIAALPITPSDPSSPDDGRPSEKVVIKTATVETAH